MKNIRSYLSVLLVGGIVGTTGVAAAFDGILLKEEISPGYCHLKFPAIKESTLSSNHPVLKDPKTGDIIDFYGRCDEDPLGKDQVAAQKLVNEERGFLA
jgi:hypothetical protein